MIPTQKRGWCPTLHTPMPTGDGLLLRVKPPLACLTPTQARTLAAAAARHGNGIIELTQRGNLQVRGLTTTTTAPFAAAMIGAGLGFPPIQEGRRPVMPPPLLGEDPTIAPGAAALTARLEHAFATDPRLAALPAKFALHIDAGGILGARPAAAALVAWTDGVRTGLRTGGRTDAPVLAGPLPYPGTDAAFALAPPFGQLDAAMLQGLAALAERWHTTLRITPWRAILLARVPLAAPIAEQAGPAWITHPTDPRLYITACIGAPGCRSGTTPTRADAARLAVESPLPRGEGWLRALAASPTFHTNTPSPQGGLLHVSGCAKGCAHPGPAALTLVGHGGHYDLVRNGRASDPPQRSGLPLDDLLRA